MYPDVHAGSAPDRPAVVVAGTEHRLSFARLAERSARLARLLHDRGLRHGDVVALIAPPDLVFLETYWAALRGGLYVTPVNPDLTVHEVRHILRDSGARAVVTAAELASIAEPAMAWTPRVTVRLAYGGPVSGHEHYEAGLARSLPLAPRPDPVRPWGQVLPYTVGATGLPRGVWTPLPGDPTDEPDGDRWAALLTPLFGIGPDTVCLLPGPLHRALPLRLASVVHAAGGTVVLLPDFDAATALAAMARHRVTHSLWTPTMLARLLRMDEAERAMFDLSSLRVAVHGEAPCPVEVKRAMLDWWGPVLHELYVATEGHGCTVIDSAQWLARPGSVGRAGIGTVRVCGVDGSVLPSGRSGLVYFERDRPPFSYHNQPAATAATRHPEHPNWTTVGDVGYLDPDGYLFLTGHLTQLILSGGLSVSPLEVERALAGHPAVFDVAVVGVPDPELGERVVAVVQPVAGWRPGPELAVDLRRFATDRLAAFKVPHSVEFTRRLPRARSGRLLKHELLTDHRT